MLLSKNDLARLTRHDREQVLLFQDFLRAVGPPDHDDYAERLAAWIAVDPEFRSQWLGMPMPPTEPLAPA